MCRIDVEQHINDVFFPVHLLVAPAPAPAPAQCRDGDISAGSRLAVRAIGTQVMASIVFQVTQFSMVELPPNALNRTGVEDVYINMFLLSVTEIDW